jgi:hypothetical protein
VVIKICNEYGNNYTYTTILRFSEEQFNLVLLIVDPFPEWFVRGTLDQTKSQWSAME